MFINSLCPLLNELERIAQWIGNTYPELNERRIVIIIQTQGQRHCLGLYTPRKWCNDDKILDEIQVSSEWLHRPVMEIVGIIIHEMCHMLAEVRGINDATKNGHHNKHFKKIAEEVGLTVDKPIDFRGYTYTSIGNQLKERMLREVQFNEKVFNLFQIIQRNNSTE